MTFDVKNDDHICPECQAGKHRNCDGVAWCKKWDEEVPCACPGPEGPEHEPDALRVYICTVCHKPVHFDEDINQWVHTPPPASRDIHSPCLGVQ